MIAAREEPGIQSAPPRVIDEQSYEEAQVGIPVQDRIQERPKSTGLAAIPGHRPIQNIKETGQDDEAAPLSHSPTAIAHAARRFTPRPIKVRVLGRRPKR